jgi:hypothetical protein
MTDSPLSARSTPLHFIFADFNSVPLRSDGRKLPRQSENVVRARKLRIPEAAMLRISATTSNRPRDFVRPSHSITARGSACRRGQSISPRCYARARHQK